MVKEFFNRGSHKGNNKEFNNTWEYFVNSVESGQYKPTLKSRAVSRGNYITLKYYSKKFHRDNNGQHPPSYPVSESIDHENSNFVKVKLIKPQHKSHIVNNTKNNIITSSGKNTNSNNQGGFKIKLNQSGENKHDEKQNNLNDDVFSTGENEKTSDLQPNGVLKLYIYRGKSLPAADTRIAFIGGKSDPYTFVYQQRGKKPGKNTSKEPSQVEKSKYCTHVVEHICNPWWIDEKDVALMSQGQKPMKQPKCIKLNVIVCC